MTHIYVRPLRVHDAEDVARAEKFLSRAEIDPKTLAYPSTRILVAEKDGEPILYQPVYSAYVLGSLGFDDASNFELAEAMHQILAAVVYESNKAGNGMVLALSGHKDTDRFMQRHQFKLPEHPILEME